MYYPLLVIVLCSSIGNSVGKHVRNPKRISALIDLINRYTVDHGEALEVLSIADLRKRGYHGYYNYSVDYNLKPPLSTYFNVHEYLTGVLLNVNHNGTTEWTTTTFNSLWRRGMTDRPPVVYNKKRSTSSSSGSSDDSESNERRIPNGRRYSDSADGDFILPDAIKDVTPFKPHYEDIYKNIGSPQKTNFNINGREGDIGKSNESDRDEKRKDLKKDRSNNWNKPNEGKKDVWDVLIKTERDWDEKPKKSNDYIKSRIKESSVKDFDKPIFSKKVKDSLEYYKHKKNNRNEDSDDYGYGKRKNKDISGNLKMKAKDDYDMPLKNSRHKKRDGEFKSKEERPLKISWYSKKDDNWNKKTKDDWDKPLSDSWDTKKGNKWDKKPKDDWDKPLKDDWGTKKVNKWDKKPKDDWDKPLNDNRDTKKLDKWDKNPKDNWDKPLKDNWDVNKDAKRVKKPKDDWDKPLKENWDTKKDDKNADDWDKPVKANWNKKPKNDWDNPKKEEWDGGKSDRERKRPKISDIIRERHKYPAYDERPRKRVRAAGGHGRTPIPFVGKRGIYEEK